MDIATERAHMRAAVEILREMTGVAPQGWYTCRDSPNTRQLVVEHGGFAYDSDYYGDDLPFWTSVALADDSAQPHLVVPYTLDSNDMRFAALQGFLDYVQSHERVWICRRIDIAEHWRATHPYQPKPN